MHNAICLESTLHFLKSLQCIRLGAKVLKGPFTEIGKGYMDGHYAALTSYFRYAQSGLKN